MLAKFQAEVSRFITFDSDSIKDYSKGCDQLVWRVNAKEFGQVIVKIPKEEKDKVEKQYIMSEKALKFNFNASHVVFVTADFLIEKFVVGEQLSFQSHPDKEVWVKLGQQMKILHSVPGATGFSNRVVGESCEKFPIFPTYREKMIGNIEWSDCHEIIGIDRYLSEMLAINRGIKPSFLHYDIAFDNIIVSNDHATVTLIDFADAGMGDPLEDFAFLYCFLYNAEQLDWLFDGYGGVSSEDRVWVEFYCIVWMTWALSGDDKPERRAQQLKVAENIVKNGLIWLETNRD